jgi:hypothetical protein
MKVGKSEKTVAGTVFDKIEQQDCPLAVAEILDLW